MPGLNPQFIGKFPVRPVRSRPVEHRTQGLERRESAALLAVLLHLAEGPFEELRHPDAVKQFLRGNGVTVRQQITRAARCLRFPAGQQLRPPQASPVPPRKALENGRKAMAEPDAEGMAAWALAQVHLAEAMLARSRGEGDREERALTAASQLIVSDSGRIPQTLTIRLHEDLMHAWAARANRLAEAGQPALAAAATGEAIRCGIMMTGSQPGDRRLKAYWTQLMLRAAERHRLSGDEESAYRNAEGARQRFRQLRNSGEDRYEHHSLGACEAGVLLAEAGSPLDEKASDWLEIARRDLDEFVAESRDRLRPEHAERVAALRERLDRLTPQVGSSR